MSSLPPSGEIMRHRTDENSGAKTVEWFGRESFIKGMGLPGKRVMRILDPKRGAVLFGPPLDRFEPLSHYG